jgi:hypothetical protein
LKYPTLKKIISLPNLNEILTQMVSEILKIGYILTNLDENLPKEGGREGVDGDG